MIDMNTQWQLRRDAQLCSDDERGQRLVELRENIEAALKEVHTCCPGIIDSFDAATQTAQIQPSIQKFIGRDREEGQWIQLPPLVAVPIVALSGAGFALTFPIESGDQCLLLFSERAIDNWLEQGGTSELSQLRRHSMSDAFALVGIRSQNHALTNYNTDAIELRSADSQTRIRLTKDNRILLDQANNHIEMSGSEIKLTAPTVRVEGQMIVSGDVIAGGISLRTHVHGGVYSGGSVTSPPQ